MTANKNSNMNELELPYRMLLVMAELETQAHVRDGNSDDSSSGSTTSLDTQPPKPTGRAGHDDDEFNANDDDTQSRKVKESERMKLLESVQAKQQIFHEKMSDEGIFHEGDDVTEAAQTGTSNIITPETNNHGFPTPNRDFTPPLQQHSRPADAGTKMDIEKGEGLTGDKDGLVLTGRENERQKEPTALAGTDDRRSKSKRKQPRSLFNGKRKKKTKRRDVSDEDFQVEDDDDKIEEVYSDTLASKMKAPATIRQTRNQVHKEIPWGDS